MRQLEGIWAWIPCRVVRIKLMYKLLGGCLVRTGMLSHIDVEVGRGKFS